MSGEIISKPVLEHHCSPGWEWREAEPDSTLTQVYGPGARYGVSPHGSDFPKGTTWLCECGQVWVSRGILGLVGNIYSLEPHFRRERWWERRRRLRR